MEDATCNWGRLQETARYRRRILRKQGRQREEKRGRKREKGKERRRGDGWK